MTITSNKYLLWLCGAIALTLAITFGIISCFLKYTAFQTLPGNTNKTVTTTDEWKTYLNEQYGFELKYPSDWKVSEVAIGDGTEIRFETLDAEERIKQGELDPGDQYSFIITSLSSIDNFWNVEKTRLGGMLVGSKRAYEYIQGGAAAHYAVLVEGDGRYVDLYFGRTSSKEKLPEAEKRVLSSFRFVEPTNISTWQTYRNEEYGFELKYPGDWTQVPSSIPDSGIIFSFTLRDPKTQLFKQSDQGGSDLPDPIVVRVYSGISDMDTKKLGAKNLAEFLQKYAALPDPTYQNIQAVKVGNVDGYRAEAGPNQFGGGMYYFIQASGHIYEIWFFGVDKNDRVDPWQTILASFNFFQ